MNANNDQPPKPLIEKLKIWFVPSFGSNISNSRNFTWRDGGRIFVLKKYEEASKFLSTTKGLLVLLGVLAVFALAHDLLREKKVAVIEKSPSETADTYIPSGFVLVPIEIQNIEGLDSILGQFGVVDLFLPGHEGLSRGRLVARRLKILRAPLNPSQFAVLAPEGQAPDIVRHEGPFIVVIQNPKESGTRIVKQKVRRSRISFDHITE